jgi:hypothetical protein
MVRQPSAPLQVLPAIWRKGQSDEHTLKFPGSEVYTVRMNSDQAQFTEPSYIVSLKAADDAPAALRIAAEIRFAAALERSLGGPTQVARTYRAWTAANEGTAQDLDKDTIEAAMRWPRAADLARQAGLREIGDLPTAHFEVKLPKHQARR